LLHLDKFPQTHDLECLRRLLENKVPDVEFTKEGAGILNRVNSFFSLRYPVPAGSQPIGSQDLRPIVALAHALVAAYPGDIRSAFQSTLTKGNRVLFRFPENSEGAV
jgi:hypothetical protein